MASSPSLSFHSGFSLSASNSSSSLSYLHSKNAPARTLPHRGQIKAAIFASFFASVVRLLGASTPDESANANGANSHDGAGSIAPRSDSREDVEGGEFTLSVRSSPASNLSVPATPDSLFDTFHTPAATTRECVEEKA